MEGDRGAKQSDPKGEAGLGERGREPPALGDPRGAPRPPPAAEGAPRPPGPPQPPRGPRQGRAGGRAGAAQPVACSAAALNDLEGWGRLLRVLPSRALPPSILPFPPSLSHGSGAGLPLPLPQPLLGAGPPGAGSGGAAAAAGHVSGVWAAGTGCGVLGGAPLSPVAPS